MISDALWYPLWSDAVIADTASNLSKVIGTTSLMVTNPSPMVSPAAQASSPPAAVPRVASSASAVVVPRASSHSSPASAAPRVALEFTSGKNPPSTTSAAGLAMNRQASSSSEKQSEYVVSLAGTTVNAPAATISSIVDVSPAQAWAWGIVTDPAATDKADTFRKLLDDMGVNRPEDLEFLATADHQKLQARLKTAKQRGYQLCLAWGVLGNPFNTVDPIKLQKVLAEWGVGRAANLALLEAPEVATLASLLKKIPRKQFQLLMTNYL